MTCEANCTGAFYKHLRFGFGILEFGIFGMILQQGIKMSIFWCFYVNSPGFEAMDRYVSMGGEKGEKERQTDS